MFVANEQDDPLDLAELRSLAEKVLADENYPDQTEMTLLFVSEDEMAGYNERFLSRDGPTDVLAFPVEDLLPGVVPEVNPHGPPLMLGDVIVAPSYVRRQADDFGVTFESEMSLMVAHGTLHLLGYDHKVDEEAERMEGRERALLASIGLERR